MFERRSLRWPITLGVVMFIVLVALLVGWVLLSWFGLSDSKRAGLYIALLSIGATLLTLAIIGTALYLTLSIQAINLSRRQSNFIDSVTHELKSPIASLKLYLQTLSRRQISTAEQEVFFKDMLEDVERLDQLFNHLLDVARLEKDRVGPPPTDVRLDEVIRSCTKTICDRHERPSETVDLKLLPVVVSAARVDLELVFRNLIDNAIKYADDEQPLVEISIQSQGANQAIVRISDNGRGIPHSLRHLIFGRFVRLGSELERAKPGTGLGLYIVRTIIGRLGGKIRIGEREGGSGVSFEVQLPARFITPANGASEVGLMASPANAVHSNGSS
jgi:two-component system, OmpR family, phosphate regulon sensor histidine kinase PhoR